MDQFYITVDRLNKEDGDKNVKDADTHIPPRKDGEKGKYGGSS